MRTTIDYADPRYVEYSAATVAIDWAGESAVEPTAEEAAYQRWCWAQIQCPIGRVTS